MSGSPQSFRSAFLLAALTSAAIPACDDRALPIAPEEAFAREHAAHVVGAVMTDQASYQHDLATLRQVVAPFHNFDKAEEAGWDRQFTPCITGPDGISAMGFHYVNDELMDGTTDVASPEALLYEPDENGRLRLVAVEYLIPFTVHPAGGVPPTLWGLPFAPSAAFGVWGLHAWVGRDNPRGMHSPFNPNVSCADA